jgi:hypothetical protein
MRLSGKNLLRREELIALAANTHRWRSGRKIYGGFFFLGTIFAAVGLRRMINEARFFPVVFVFRRLLDFFLAMPDLIAERAMDSIQIAYGRDLRAFH